MTPGTLPTIQNVKSDGKRWQRERYDLTPPTTFCNSMMTEPLTLSKLWTTPVRIGGDQHQQFKTRGMGD